MSQLKCPLCNRVRGKPVIEVKRESGEQVFVGCADCLIHLVDEYNRRVLAPTCHLCGSEKEKALFAGGGQGLECSLHYQSRFLLGQGLQHLSKALGNQELDRRQVETWCLNTAAALGATEIK